MKRAINFFYTFENSRHGAKGLSSHPGMWDYLAPGGGISVTTAAVILWNEHCSRWQFWEKSSVNYFNWKKEQGFFSFWPVAEYSTRDCHLQLLLSSLLLFLYEMTYRTSWHGFIPGKIKGFPMEVLSYSRWREESVYFGQAVNFKCDEISVALWRCWGLPGASPAGTCVL